MGGFDRHHARRCGGDLRQSEQILVAANARIGAARALYFPSISISFREVEDSLISHQKARGQLEEFMASERPVQA